MEVLLLALFAAALLICVFTGQSVLLALLIGYVIFFSYGIRKGKSVRKMLQYSLRGVMTVRNVIFTFLLIGILTATWRSSGTIAYVVYYTSALCKPYVMLLMDFLLCALISFLTGTSFGTVATMGLISSMISVSMGLPLYMIGGAVLAGVFFGDRCSPVSTSALLVSELTHTNLYTNLGKMVRTSIVPFIISCLVYYLLGLQFKAGVGADTTREVLRDGFVMSPVLLLPVAAVLVLSLLRCSVKITLTVSSAFAILLTVLVQGMDVSNIPWLCVMGYIPASEKLAAIISGGGIQSMVSSFCIVALSSSYAGMFRGTGFLDGIQTQVTKLGEKITPFGAVVVTSMVTCGISCNQTLATMLTDQLCERIVPDHQQRAIDLENSVIILAALTPWSIACAVPLATIGAPSVSVLFAVYLWLLPLYNLVVRATHM